MGTFTCITGVSGSGKSTLTLEALKKIYLARINGKRKQNLGNTIVSKVFITLIKLLILTKALLDEPHGQTPQPIRGHLPILGIGLPPCLNQRLVVINRADFHSTPKADGVKVAKAMV